MATSGSSIHVVQCPKCGSSVDIDRAHDGYVQCSYCGSTLELATGSSGHPVAKLSRIEANTAFLARSEAAKRLRSQRERLEEKVPSLEHELSKIDMKGNNVLFGCLLAPVAMGFVGAGIDIGSKHGFGAGAMVLLILGAALAGSAVACWTANRRAKERKHQLQDQLQAVRVEKQRLTDRLRRLDAGLDEEANQL